MKYRFKNIKTLNKTSEHGIAWKICAQVRGSENEYPAYILHTTTHIIKALQNKTKIFLKYVLINFLII